MGKAGHGSLPPFWSLVKRARSCWKEEGIFGDATTIRQSSLAAQQAHQKGWLQITGTISAWQYVFKQLLVN
jgi:hypothetical protein